MDDPAQDALPLAMDDANVEDPRVTAGIEVVADDVPGVLGPELVQVEEPVDRMLDDIVPGALGQGATFAHIPPARKRSPICSTSRQTRRVLPPQILAISSSV